MRYNKNGWSVHKTQGLSWGWLKCLAAEIMWRLLRSDVGTQTIIIYQSTYLSLSVCLELLSAWQLSSQKQHLESTCSKRRRRKLHDLLTIYPVVYWLKQSQAISNSKEGDVDLYLSMQKNLGSPPHLTESSIPCMYISFEVLRLSLISDGLIALLRSYTFFIGFVSRCLIF